MHVPVWKRPMTRAASWDEPGVMPAIASSVGGDEIVTSALNTLGTPRCRGPKNGRNQGVPTDLGARGGTAASPATAVDPRIERPAVTREDTTFEVKATVTSGVGSGNGAAPPASTVREKKVFVDAPGAMSMFWMGL